jgi:hypothetical protein
MARIYIYFYFSRIGQKSGQMELVDIKLIDVHSLILFLRSDLGIYTSGVSMDYWYKLSQTAAIPGLKFARESKVWVFVLPKGPYTRTNLRTIRCTIWSKGGLQSNLESIVSEMCLQTVVMGVW